MRKRPYTPVQASRTLPLVERIAADVVRESATLSRWAEEYRALRSDRRADAVGIEDRRSRIARLKERMSEVSRRIDACAAELAEIGCELKDTRTGEVDFPARQEGRPVLLCWLPGDGDVGHWHETTAGAEERKPLPVGVSGE